MTTPQKLTVDLANGDCLEYLKTVKDGSVDLVLVDPPYEISRETGFQSVKDGVPRFAVSMDFTVVEVLLPLSRL